MTIIKIIIYTLFFTVLWSSYVVSLKGTKLNWQWDNGREPSWKCVEIGKKYKYKKARLPQFDVLLLALMKYTFFSVLNTLNII